jgi:hypothetical protein
MFCSKAGSQNDRSVNKYILFRRLTSIDELNKLIILLNDGGAREIN